MTGRTLYRVSPVSQIIINFIHNCIQCLIIQQFIIVFNINTIHIFTVSYQTLNPIVQPSLYKLNTNESYFSSVQFCPALDLFHISSRAVLIHSLAVDSANQQRLNQCIKSVK